MAAMPDPAADPEELMEGAEDHLELKRRYDDLVSRNLAGVFRTTVDGRFLECNDAMARILGYAGRDELMRLSAADLYGSAREREEFLEALFREKKLINY